MVFRNSSGRSVHLLHRPYENTVGAGKSPICEADFKWAFVSNSSGI